MLTIHCIEKRKQGLAKVREMREHKRKREYQHITHIKYMQPKVTTRGSAFFVNFTQHLEGVFA